MTTELQLSRSVGAIIAAFAENPFLASRDLRQLLALDPVSFREAVLSLLVGESFTQGHQYALTLLLSEGLVLDRLCDPRAMNRKEAGRLVRRIDSLNPTLIVSMASALLRGHAFRGISSSTAAIRQVLELLDHSAGVQRVTLLLTQLLQHSDERIRAKATLLLGKINQNLKWAEERMNDTDPRVRASAIEAMWCLDSPEARRTFDSALQDSHGRVAANAAFGLYCLGDLSAPIHLIQMLASTEPMRRASAIWVMGQTGDSRFVSHLSPYAMDPDPIVRRNAFLALSTIRLRVKRLTEEHPLEVVVTKVETLNRVRRLEIAIFNSDCHPVTKISPLNFVVRDGGRIRHRLKVGERQQPECTNVAFAAPEVANIQQLAPALNRAFQMFLHYKRKSDAWSALRYFAADTDKPGTQSRDANPPYQAAGQTTDFQEFRKYMPKSDAPMATRHSTADYGELGTLPRDAMSPGSGPVPSSFAPPERTLDPGPRRLEFALNANALLAVSDSAGTVAFAAENLHDAIASLIGSLAFSQGARYIFLVAPDSTVLNSASCLAQKANDARIEISALLIGVNRHDAIGGLCRETGGVSIAVASQEELPEASRRIAARLASFYKIEYEAPDDTESQLSVQVLSEDGCGKDELGAQRDI